MRPTNFLAFAFALYLAVVLDAAVGGLLAVTSSRPALTLLVGLLAALQSRGRYRFALPAIAGLADDLATPGLLGAAMLLGWLLGWVVMKHAAGAQRRPIGTALIVLAVTLAWALGTTSLDRAFGYSDAALVDIFIAATGNAVLNAVAALMLFTVAMALGRRIHSEAPFVFDV